MFTWCFYHLSRQLRVVSKQKAMSEMQRKFEERGLETSRGQSDLGWPLCSCDFRPIVWPFGSFQIRC